MNYTIERDERPARKPIDYDRMRFEHPRLKAALTRARKTEDPVKVADACIKAVKVWDECNAWPDNWSDWQRALDDVLPWNQQASLEDVAYGRVRIRAVAE